MRHLLITLCCLVLGAGVATADVPAGPPTRPVPRPASTTVATTVRVSPASAGTSHPARVQVKVPRATLQALLQRASHGERDPVAIAQLDEAGGPSWRIIRAAIAAVALALAVLSLPLLRRRRGTGVAVAVLLLAAAWTAHAATAQGPTPARATTQPTPATLELVVTDDGSSGILLTHATPR